MSIISKISTRKQFKEMTEHSNLIYNKAIECLAPANKVYWFYYLQIKNADQPCSLQEIEMSMLTIIQYIDQLKHIENEIISMYKSNHKVLAKYRTYYEKAIKNLTNFQREIYSIDKNIKEIPDYTGFNEFKLILKYIDLINSKLHSFAKSKDLENAISEYAF